ncbi:MAG: hypothetical protein EOO15_06860 [Chitinophagaceae bacterium]|nr:MAG: hypothetical protein EOO15_06860 [Chitinophagaceae bacterium]
MNRTILLALCLFGAAPVFAQQKSKATNAASRTQVVETSCGKCKFGMAGDECALAVRINGKPYLVDGVSIDQYGDAHASDGFCNAIRQAQVTGRVSKGRYRATSFKLLPASTRAAAPKG